MAKNYVTIVLRSLVLSVVGVFVIDYFSHLLFSNPMETVPYFIAKMTVYFVFSLLFLFFINLDTKEFVKVVIAGIVVSLLRGMYYNVLPVLFDYYPSGIALEGLTFLDMGLWGTGLAFGIVHTLAFIGGYYVSRIVVKK